MQNREKLQTAGLHALLFFVKLKKLASEINRKLASYSDFLTH